MSAQPELNLGTKSKGMDASDVLRSLRRHYVRKPDAPAGLFLPEVGAPDGRRRADLLWIPAALSGATDTGIVGHEIKVSRADVLHELEDPSKAHSWAQYCTKWWLVVADVRLVAGLKIPEQWGVMAPPTSPRRKQPIVVKDAPKLDPVPLEKALGRLSTVLAYQAQAKDEKLHRLEREHRRLSEQIDEAAQNRAAAIRRDESPHMAHLGKVADAIMELLRGDQVKLSSPNRTRAYSIEGISPERIARAVVDLDEAERLAAAVQKDVADRFRHLELLTTPAFTTQWLAEVRSRLEQLTTADSDDEFYGRPSKAS